MAALSGRQRQIRGHAITGFAANAVTKPLAFTKRPETGPNQFAKRNKNLRTVAVGSDHSVSGTFVVENHSSRLHGLLISNGRSAGYASPKPL